MSDTISTKQERFLEEYVKTGNGVESYHKIYGCKWESARTNASRLLKVPKIQARLKELNEVVTMQQIADIKECLETLTEFIRDESISKNDRLRAIDMRLKTLGAYIDKKQIEGNIETEIVVSVESDED